MDYLGNPSLANTSDDSLSDKQNHSRNIALPTNRHSSLEYTSLGEEDISRHGSDGANNPRGVSDVSSYLLDGSLGSKKRYAEWGIHWFRNPLKLPLLTLCGTALAIGHHLTFARFNGKIVSESLYVSQTAVKQIGNVLVFLVLASFKSVINDSYNQYIWMIVRRDSFKVQTLNKAFSLPTSPFSFFSLDLLQSAKLGFLLGIFSWFLFLGGLTPAATLSIIPSFQPKILPGQIPVPDYDSPLWYIRLERQTDINTQPTPEMIKIATEAALTQTVIPPPAPGLNTSFSTHFYGPTVQCSTPTQYQQGEFDNFSNKMSIEDSVVTAQLFNASVNLDSDLLLLSAFSPTTHIANDDSYLLRGESDPSGNWDTIILGKNANGTQQLWIQTANSSFVCALVNASFAVNFNYSDGVGTVASQSVTVLPGNNTFANGINVGDYTGGADNLTAAYFTTFLSLGSMIFGNISLEHPNNCWAVANLDECKAHAVIAEESSRALSTGLAACDEISNNYWLEKYAILYDFASEPWMCRNRSLSRAIEDMANNITISMLSGANFTKSIPGHVFSLTNVELYEYDMTNLLVSYAAVLLVTLIAMCVGIYSLLENGVYHDTTFSTFMATTRNIDLDTMSDGTCLGDVKKIEQRKLMFGMLINDRRTGSEESVPVNGETGSDYPHAAFGLEGTVVRLRKGAPCS